MMIDRPHLIKVAQGAEPADLVLRGGRIVGVTTREIFDGDIVIAGDRIAAIAAPGEYKIDDSTEIIDLDGRHVSPGLIDSHIHIESSNLTVTELARAIVPRGVLTLIADPHEIANVLGLPGMELLLDEAAELPLDVFLRVPGRVPALPAHLETSGHEFDLASTITLLDRPDAACLGGDINPALLLGADPDQLAKIQATIDRGLTVGGQLPGFTGAILNASIVSGIEDTHVAESPQEVIDQLRRGLRVLLTPRIDRLPEEQWPDLVRALRSSDIDTRYLVLCTDDVHPNMLRKQGHLDYRVRLAIASGFHPAEAIQMATLNAAELMRLDRDRGSVAPGKLADLVILDDLPGFVASATIQRGRVVARDGQLTSEVAAPTYPGWSTDTIHLPRAITAADMAVRTGVVGSVMVNTVEFGGPKLMRTLELRAIDGIVMPDTTIDVVSIAVFERHKASGARGLGFVTGLGITGGAVACTVNHDSHNIFVVGDDHESMAIAANAVADAGGGYAAVVDHEVRAIVPLRIAGLLSEEPLDQVADALDNVERVLLEELGCSIGHRPLYALNFLCLPNIPDVGVTDMGIIETATLRVVPTMATAGTQR